MKRKQTLILSITFLVASAVCLYCAVIADFSVGAKICFGAAAATFYVVMNLIPFFVQRRRGDAISLKAYLKSYLDD